MSYVSTIATVASEHRPMIEADLSRALAQQKAAAAEVERANRRVHFLQTLAEELREPPDDGDESESNQMTLPNAMHAVLKEKGKLKATPLIEEISRRGLYRTRKGGPPSSQQLHSRATSRPDLIGKDGSYFYAK